jgi:hypothetical protein
MDLIQNMGTAADRRLRITQGRVDSHERQFDITNARRLIYEQNYAVDSKSLSNFLGSKSWVPTSVSYHFPSTHI